MPAMSVGLLVLVKGTGLPYLVKKLVFGIPEAGSRIHFTQTTSHQGAFFPLTLAGVMYTPKCATNSYGYMGSGELPHGAR